MFILLFKKIVLMYIMQLHTLNKHSSICMCYLYLWRVSRCPSNISVKINYWRKMMHTFCVVDNYLSAENTQEYCLFNKGEWESVIRAAPSNVSKYFDFYLQIQSILKHDQNFKLKKWAYSWGILKKVFIWRQTKFKDSL